MVTEIEKLKIEIDVLEELKERIQNMMKDTA
jgi:hypothetical protein